MVFNLRWTCKKRDRAYVCSKHVFSRCPFVVELENAKENLDFITMDTRAATAVRMCFHFKKLQSIICVYLETQREQK